MKQGDAFTLTANELLGSRHRVLASFPRLPAVVKPGDCLFLNDSNIRLEVANDDRDGDIDPVDLILRNVRHAVAHLTPTAVIVPTPTGYTARMVSRLPEWIAGVSPDETTCHSLQFPYEVIPVHAPEVPRDWNEFEGPQN